MLLLPPPVPHPPIQNVVVDLSFEFRIPPITGNVAPILVCFIFVSIFAKDNITLFVIKIFDAIRLNETCRHELFRSTLAFSS